MKTKYIQLSTMAVRVVGMSNFLPCFSHFSNVLLCMLIFTPALVPPPHTYLHGIFRCVGGLWWTVVVSTDSPERPRDPQRGCKSQGGLGCRCHLGKGLYCWRQDLKTPGAEKVDLSVRARTSAMACAALDEELLSALNTGVLPLKWCIRARWCLKAPYSSDILEFCSGGVRK